MNSPRARWGLWQTFLLLVALWWAPIWGHWHGVAHRTLPTGFVSVDVSISHAHGVGVARIRSEQGSNHLGHPVGSDLCQVFDHLAHADRLIASIVAWSTPRQAAQPSIFHARSSFDHDRWSHPQARAPPALI
jgi:hypothetical protein